MSYTDSENDKKTYNHSAVTDLYDQLDESLSNEYQSGYLTQAGNVGLRYRAGKLSAMLGVDAQWANLKGDLVYPQPDELSHKYFPFFLRSHCVIQWTGTTLSSSVIAASHLLLLSPTCRMS